MQTRPSLRLTVGLSTAVLLATATGASAWKNPMQEHYTTGALDICDQGSFFVGGVPKVTNFILPPLGPEPQQYIIGQMYVEFQVPTRHRKWPIIMVHGGSLTGAALSSTPDGREGWDSYALRNNLATFVVDQAGRGRSGIDASVLGEAKARIEMGDVAGGLALFSNIRVRSDEIFWGFYGHIIPSGTSVLNGTMIRHGDPGDPDPPERHGTYPPLDPIPPVPNSIDLKIQARTGAIGPAPNPANNTFLALNLNKQVVPILDPMLPVSNCPSCNPTEVNSSDTWSGRDLAELVAGLGGAIVVTHSQSGTVGHHLVRFLKENGQLDKLKGLITIEGSCSLTQSGTTAENFVNIPYLAFKGDYSDIDPICEQTVAAIQAAGGKADYIKLDDPTYGGQFNGTSHMMMHTTNNLKVFDEITKWTTANIPNPIVATSCPTGSPDVPPKNQAPSGPPPAAPARTR